VLPSLGTAGQELADKCQLIHEVFERLNARAPIAAGDCVLLGSNLFLPIQDLETSVMPLDGVATYRRNTTRYGHCAGADPVINLIDYFSEQPQPAMQHALMVATAHGHFAAMLLRSQPRLANASAAQGSAAA
jgi:3-oxoacyl-[acyl-carrier-protein] synthase-3